MCIHNRVKRCCRDCGGSDFCLHNKRKSNCKDCKGGSVCQHNKLKSNCKECGSSSFCIHKKYKIFCKECDGSSICIHNIHKINCKECGGSSFCIHNKYKAYCIDCGGRRLCKQCKYIIGSSKYDGHCLRCFIYLFPDKPVSKNYKTKETTVTDYIIKEFPNFTWKNDKRIEDGCSKKRPDLLLDLGYQVIIIEIDEYQHFNYDNLCENKRIMLLSQDVNHRPIIFIRFNPDQFINKDGIQIESCWKYNKKGIMTIKKKQQLNWNNRLEKLKEQINYWINETNKSNKTIEIIQLYYNEIETEIDNSE